MKPWKIVLLVFAGIIVTSVIASCSIISAMYYVAWYVLTKW